MEKFLKDIFESQSYDEKNFFLIAGPCVVESEELLMEVADNVYAICKHLAIPYIFKASYRKANRTSGSSCGSPLRGPPPGAPGSERPTWVSRDHAPPRTTSPSRRARRTSRC